MSSNSIALDITQKQYEFISTTSTEVLFGGAAGGGKSYAQVIDGMLYALKYPGSKQIIFRQSYPELERSILRTMLSIYPQGLYTYHKTAHTFTFVNGSIIDCGYLTSDADVYKYQSAEYDVIRFDELTHFSEFTYTYMLSRLRGANDFPKYMKSSTNPTGSGRVWVKARFVDIGEWNQEHIVVVGKRSDGSDIVSKRIFIPSKVYDNRFLMAKDPDYIERLENLPEGERKGLLEGEWDYFDGQYFDEFKRDIHVCQPFPIPSDWRVYRTIDYGLDRLACYWVAVNSLREVFVYKEYCESDLPISSAASAILERTDDKEDIYITLAPPDLWNRSQESGKSKALIFEESGLDLVKSNNDREAGWLSIKELLKTDANGTPRLRIFSTCTELIACLPELQRDPKRPSDTMTEPHDITHAPDALRYFAIYWFDPKTTQWTGEKRMWRQDQWEDYLHASYEERQRMIKEYGEPNL